MGKKNECYLCGEKLHQGYCRACGLDNTKIKRRNYKLNESESVTKQNLKIKESISQDDLQKAAKSVQSFKVFRQNVYRLNMPRQMEVMNVIPKRKAGTTKESSSAGGNNFVKLIAVLCILMTAIFNGLCTD